MMDRNGIAALSESKAKRKGNSQFSEVWKRLKKNKVAMISLGIIIGLLLIGVFADLIIPYSKAVEQVASDKLAPPSLTHIFGCDALGRDMFARCIHGARTSLYIGFITTLITTFIAVVLGTLAAYKGGHTDNLIMRIVDILISIPAIILGLAIAAGLGTGIPQLMIAISVGQIPSFTRVIRAAALNVVDQDYIEAARVIGVKPINIILIHVLPNMLGTILVQATMSVAMNILLGAILSFLGLGAPVPIPEWGKLISEGLPYLRSIQHVTIFPMIFLALTALSINLFGDGLRDAFDPRLKGKA
jgi:peptide/nickel transport system permease protein